MTVINIFVLVGITATFVVFAVVLAWGEYQTRHLKRDVGQKPEKRCEARELNRIKSNSPARTDGEKSVVGIIERERVLG